MGSRARRRVIALPDCGIVYHCCDFSEAAMAQVERLTVQFSSEWEEKSGWGGNSPILAPIVGLIRQCATSLRTLNLRGVPFDELFDVRTSNGSQGDPEVFQPLLWRCLKPSGAERPTPLSAAFLSAMAAAPEPGLRLMQVDNCSFSELPAEDVFPASLRVLALYNLEEYFKGTLEHLLKDCSALEELYLCYFNTDSSKAPRFHKMRPAMANLRVLVLDCCNFSCDYCEWVPKMKDATAKMPKLETLIIQNLNCIMPAFSFLKFPRLAHLAVGFLDPAHLPWLKKFMAHSGGRLKTLQLQLTLFDEESREPSEEDYSEHDDEDQDEDESGCDKDDDDRFADLPDHARALLYAITGGRGRAPSRGRRKRRPRFEGVFKALGGAEKLEHLELVYRCISPDIAASVTDVESNSWAVLPRLETIGIFQGHNCHFRYGPAKEKGTAKYFCKEFGRLQLAGCLPALRKVYFHPVQRAYTCFRGEVKAMTGTEGFKAVALDDPGRAMGKCKLISPAHHPFRGVKRPEYLYEEPGEDNSDDEGFGQNADLDDGQLTAPGLYSECVSDGWSTDNEDYEDDISGDEPDVIKAPKRRIHWVEADEGTSDQEADEDTIDQD
ncbi:hypothetical protein COCOBI_17-2560 [Coccomyxa sp. Obi]|nr:hypothetical protein COCOBI_17-2560 [Coccomyxa sp. Obi]